MIVEMGEVIACSQGKGDDELETSGITTCIAIVLYGTFAGKLFMLMDHWDGEVHGEPDVFIESKVNRYRIAIQDSVIDDFDSDIHEDLPIYIKKIMVIGGEKEQFDEEGNQLVVGTEASVALLESTLIPELARQCTVSRKVHTSWNNFLSFGDQFINIQMNINGNCEFQLENVLDYANSFSLSPS